MKQNLILSLANLKAWIYPYQLHFKGPAGTSRGTMHQKQVYYLFLKDLDSGQTGIGECTIIPGLSLDDREDYAEKVSATANAINEGVSFETLEDDLKYFPSIVFGLETAYNDLQKGSQRLIFDTPFYYGLQSIRINGLIWMNDYETMLQQIREKIEAGFDCIKLKIGAIEWAKEMALLAHIRADYSPDKVEIRVDANGAFNPKEAFEKLKALARFQVHSIEQPIAPRQPDLIAQICQQSPVPVALDEELIGRQDIDNKKITLDTIQPQYLILKPGLIGGFRQSEEWVELAEKRQIDWWVTSALESNIGLNAIAQWVSQWDIEMPQGLGTGGLYTNNIPSPLEVENGYISINPEKNWDLSLFQSTQEK